MKFSLETVSLCPECLKPLSAVYSTAGDNVWLEKTCPDHGSFRTLVWRGPPSLEEWTGGVLCEPPFTPADNCPLSCGACHSHDRYG